MINHYLEMLIRRAHSELTVDDFAIAFRWGVEATVQIPWRGHRQPTFTTDSAFPTGITMSEDGVLTNNGVEWPTSQETTTHSIIATDGETTVNFTVTIAYTPAILEIEDQTINFVSGSTGSVPIEYTSDNPISSWSFPSGDVPAGVSIINGVTTYDGRTVSSTVSKVITARLQSKGAIPAQADITINVNYIEME